MVKYFKRRINRNFLLLLLSDLTIIAISFYLSLLFRFDFAISNEVWNLLTPKNITIFILIKIFFFRLFRLYRGMWRYTSVWDMLNILKANSLSSFFLVCLVILTFGFENISRSVFIIDYIICIGFISVSRLGIRMFFSHFIDTLRSTRINQDSQRILLIGAGDTGQQILRQALQKNTKGLKVIGFLDDDHSKIGNEIHGVPILGKIDKLSSMDIIYDQIYICIPSANRRQMRNIVELCKTIKKPFKTLPSIGGIIEGKVSITQFREVSLVDLLGRKEVSLDKSSINDFIKGKRVIVTGAGGSIGSELVRQCIKFKPSILILVDISELNLFEIDREINNENSKILFKPILADIRDNSVVKQLFDEFKPQIVFHAAAYKHVPMQEYFPWEAVKTNVFGTSNVSDIAIEFNVEKFVLVSTDKAVKPTNVMGATKRLAEMITLNYNRLSNSTEFMAVRFGNVLGSSGSVIPIFQEQIRKGGPVTITDPEMERYFMSIPEASQLILQAGALGNGGEVFILDMGQPIKIIDIANELIRLSGYEPDLDIPIKFTGTRPGEKKVEELALPSEKLDRTKHDKIFVLNDLGITNKTLENIISGIDELKIGLSGRTANQVRSILSSILPEYEPYISSNDSAYKGVKSEAEA
jgi:FlaA1/EpsC-like NDP-sugar epimerase